MLVLLAWVVARRCPARWMTAGIILLALSAVLTERKRIEPIPADGLYAPPPGYIRADSAGPFRVADRSMNSNAPLHGLSLTANHVVTQLDPESYKQFWQSGTYGRFAVANAKYWHKQSRDVAQCYPPSQNEWGKLPGIEVLPRTSLYWNTRIIPDDSTALEQIDSQSVAIHDTLILHDRALSDAATEAQLAPTPEIEGSAEILVYEPGRIRVRYDGPRDGWLYLAEKFAPGWVATLDGQPVRLHRAFVAFEAVAAPAGTHILELTYEPASIRIGIWISLGFALAAVVAMVLPRFNRAVAAPRAG